MQTEEKKKDEGEQEKTVTVYALSMYGGYEFQNGIIYDAAAGQFSEG